MAEAETVTPSEQREDGDEPAPKSRAERIGIRFAQLFAILAVVALAVAAVAGAFEIWPDKIDAGADPSWLDNVFASKTVLFATRVVLFSAALVLFVGAAYIIWSIVVRWQNKQLLRRIGPFEISDDAVEAVSSLKNQIEELRVTSEAGEEEITSLRERLAETEDLADHFYGLWEAAIEGKEAGDRDER